MGNGVFAKNLLPGRTAADLVQVLDYVKAMRGLDFNAYLPDSLRRRLELRLVALNLPDYQSYGYYLQKNDREIDVLIDSLTLKVSRFFRNPFVFEAIFTFLLPRLIASAGSEPLRVWCAGCAKGEEPYSLAILFRELLSKHLVDLPPFILATDIDEQALRAAQAAVYPEEAVAEVKKALLDRYFSLEQGQYRLHEEIKEMVTFARHDVTAAKAPTAGVFSGYHLILCRNVLIYFDRKTQIRTTTFLAAGLFNGGALVLGEVETLPQDLPGFVEVLPESRIFLKEN